jgi:hypothetical protein
MLRGGVLSQSLAIVSVAAHMFLALACAFMDVLKPFDSQLSIDNWLSISVRTGR